MEDLVYFSLVELEKSIEQPHLLTPMNKKYEGSQSGENLDGEYEHTSSDSEE